ncbi:uncharacterized protein LOC135343054 isoform X6 [Halichondria panicea]
MQTGKATIYDLLKALKSKDIDRSDIVSKIQSLEGEMRENVGLPKEISETKCEELALIGAPTLEELCEISLGADWYLLGLWLGLEDTTLSIIKYYEYSDVLSLSENLLVLKNVMFKKYMEKSYKTEHYRHFSSQLSLVVKYDVDDFFSKKYSTQVNKLEEIEQKLGDSHKVATFQKLFQTQQENRHGMKKNMLIALLRAHFIEEAEKFCSTQGMKLDDFMAENHLLFPDPLECVVSYASYLKGAYKQMPVMPNDWPPEIDIEQQYTKLALIHVSGYYKESSTMEHDYIHGKVDNIVAEKEEIEMNEVFYPIINLVTQKSRLTILMDGAPGVGKTTITRKLCIDWAKGEILKEYHLVILVELREFELNEKNEIVDILLFESLDQVKEVVKHLENPDSLGAHVLLIFDGFDELSAKNRSKQSLFSKIIAGKKLQNCSILITSRPYASGYLKTLQRVNRRVEVLGFSKQQIINYVEKNLVNKAHADTLIQMLKDRLDILSLCYIPLNCRIVLFVFQYLQHNLPATITELYETFILHTIKHHIEKCEENLDEIDDIRSTDSLSNLPPHILRNLDQLSNIAYTGMLQDKLSFQNDNKNVLRLGLLTSHHGITVKSMKCNYQFLHLTIQEFLAARHLMLSSENKLDFFRSHLEKVRFRMVCLFLAGLSKLKFLPPNEPLLGDTVLDLTSSIDEHKISAQDKFLLLAHIVYESQLLDSSQVIPIKSNILDLSGRHLTRFDATIIAKYISATPANHKWEVIDLKDCQLPDESSIYTAMHSINSKMIAIGMSKILSLGCVTFATVLPIMNAVTELSFFLIETISHDMMKEMCMAITSSQTLTKINLPSSEISKKSLTLSSRDMYDGMCTDSFNQLLGFVDTSTLSELSIPYLPHIFTSCDKCDQLPSNTLTSLCKLIERSSSLKYVNVSFCDLSSESIGALLSAVKNSIVSLNIIGNHLDSGVALPLRQIETTEIGGFSCKSKNKTIILEHLRYGHDDSLEYPHETFLVPDYISNVILILNEITKLEIPVSKLAVLWRANQHLKNFIMTIKYNLDWQLLNLEKEDYKPNEDSLLTGSALTRNSVSIMELCKSSITIECLKMLFRFVTDEVESIHIIDQTLLMGCDVLLCKLICLSKKIKAIDLFNCNLTKETLHSIVQSLSQSSSTIESINLEGNEIMEVKTICNLVSMLETVERVPAIVKIEIVGYTFNFRTFHDGYSSLSVTLKKAETIELEMLIEIMKFPSNIQRIHFTTSSHCILNAVLISKLIIKTPNLVDIFIPQLEGSCHDTATLAKSLVGQEKIVELKSVSNKSGFYFNISRKELNLPAMYSENLCICPNALQLFIQLPQPQYLKSCNFSGQRKAFEDCPNCGSKGETAVQALCDLLAQSKTLNFIELTDCYLNKKQLQKLSYTLRDLPQVQKLDVSGTSCDAESLTVLLTTNLKEMTFLEFSLIIILDKAIKYSWKTSTENSSMLIASLVKHLLQANQHTELIMADANLTELQIKQLTQLANSSITTFHILKCSFATPHLLVSGRTFEVLTFFSTSTTSKESLGLQFFKTLNHNSFLVVLEISFINLKVDCTSEDLGGTFQIMLEENQHLQELTLNACDIDATVLCQLMKGLSKNSKLKVLHLSLLKTLNESVGPAIEFMVKENRCLHTLGISFSDIHDSVYEHIATGLGSNFTLKDLVLDGFKVTTGYFRMSNFRPTIQSVDWRKVFTILNQNNSLQTLSISTNAISKEAFDALKELLQSGPIINLYTCQCQFSPCQIQELRTILQPKGKLIHNTPYPASLHNIRNTRHIEDRLHSHF